MSRNMILGLFLVMLLPAVYAYFRRDSAAALHPSEAVGKPYVTLSNFQLDKYQNDKVVTHLEGKNAALSAVNLIEFTNHIYGWRYSKSGKHAKEELEADFVLVHLSSQRLEDFQHPVNVTDAFFGGGVLVRHEDLAISTQEAHYLGSEKNIVTGDKPVQATRDKQSVDSQNGFRLNLKDETIELLGNVKGVVNPNGSN